MRSGLALRIISLPQDTRWDGSLRDRSIDPPGGSYRAGTTFLRSSTTLDLVHSRQELQRRAQSRAYRRPLGKRVPCSSYEALRNVQAILTI